MATDWQREGRFEALIQRIIGSNPGYVGKMHRISEWLIEFDSNGSPFREIGLGKDGNVVVAGPSERDYGFWLDTNMKEEDFDGERISAETFEDIWVATGLPDLGRA